MPCYERVVPIRLYTSQVLPREGFVHGFPERDGGVSTGARASLNLGKRWGDDEANVMENRRRTSAQRAGPRRNPSPGTTGQETSSNIEQTYAH